MEFFVKFVRENGKLVMKNPTKKTLIRKLDKLVSEITRSKGYCQKCGKSFPMNRLNCHHLFSRNNKSVRWDMDNLICVCVACHFFAHQNPLLFTEFVKEFLGYKYEGLKQRATMTKQWKVFELEELLTNLGG